MLFREKFFILFIVFVAYVYVLDQITPWGNQYWELKSSNIARYAVKQKDKVGFINSRGRLVIPLNYDEGTSYSAENPILVRNEKHWGFIDHEGEIQIPFKYYWAKDFSQGLAAVSILEEGHLLPVFGFINEKGEEVIPLKYQQVRSFTNEALAAVKKDFKWGYINTHGDMIIPAVYKEASDFSERLAAARIKDKWGYINLGGQWAIEPQFQEAGHFSHGIAPVKQNGLWGYIDTTGHWVTDLEYLEAHEMTETGLAMVRNENGIGYINKDGVLAIYSVLWSQAKDFSDGLAAVKVFPNSGNPELGKWGYINTKGKLVIKDIFDLAGDFQGGLARVGLEKNDVRRGYVNKKGILIWDPADWQQTSIWNHRIHIAINVGITIYVFLLIRYIIWWIRLKKTSEVKKDKTI